MRRTVLGLIILASLLTGALLYAVFAPEQPRTDEGAVRTIVAEVLATQPIPEALPPLPETAVVAEAPVAQASPSATADTGELHAVIETYLMANPEILERMSVALQSRREAEAREAARVAIAEIRDDIFNDPGQVVLGNPEGDVTLVQLFDYNCGYCRANLPDIATLLEEDRNLRLVLKEFPILAPGSEDAARIGVVVNRSGKNYWDYHKALFTTRGPIDKQAALTAAAGLGLDRAEIEAEMQSDAVTEVLRTSFTIADKLSISGTPTFIVGDEVMVGQTGLDELRQTIANMRACGKTICSQPG